MRARLLGIAESYDNDVERQDTHPDLLLKEEKECAISQETKDLLHKAGEIRTMVAAVIRTLLKATKQTQVVVAAVLLRSMARRTQESSSHRRSVLGGKGNAICQRSIGTDRRRT